MALYCPVDVVRIRNAYPKIYPDVGLVRLCVCVGGGVFNPYQPRDGLNGQSVDVVSMATTRGQTLPASRYNTGV